VRAAANGGAGAEPAGGTPAATPANGTLTEEEVNRRAALQAAQLARINEFNRRCNEVAEVGKTKFKEEWPAIMASFNALGGLNEPLVLAALETENPADVIHYLGKNLDEAAEVLAISDPVKMAMRVAKLSAKVAPPAAPKVPPVSNAPPPVTPVNGNGAVKKRAEEADSMEEFNRIRRQELGMSVH